MSRQLDQFTFSLILIFFIYANRRKRKSAVQYAGDLTSHWCIYFERKTKYLGGCAMAELCRQALQNNSLLLIQYSTELYSMIKLSLFEEKKTLSIQFAKILTRLRMRRLTRIFDIRQTGCIRNQYSSGNC